MAFLTRAHYGLTALIPMGLASVLAMLLSGCGSPKPRATNPNSPPPSDASEPTPEPKTDLKSEPPDPAKSDPSAKHDKRAKPGTKEEIPAPPPPSPTYSAAPDGHAPKPQPVSAEPSYSMPAFQWPPPRASEEYVLPRNVFGDGSRTLIFSDVDRILVAALNSGGYTARSYYSVPKGFALATRIEQINQDGTPKMPPARFALEPEQVSVFRPMDYLKALLNGVPGYYRVIVFILTDAPFQASGAQATEAQATAWVSSGVNVLPRTIGDLPFTRDVNCTALVYEFMRKPGADSDATEFAMPGHLDAMTHLQKSGIWRGFQAH